MKVLWLTCTAAGASKIVNHSAPGRGWIASLSDLMKADDNIKLAVAFFDNFRTDFKFEYEGIIYYPMKDKLSSRVNQVKLRLMGELWDTNLPGIQNVIEDFKPDIIQIFGTESGMGDIVGNTNVPTIIHLQGLINPYVLQWLPKNISLMSILFKSKIRELIVKRDLVSEFSQFKKIGRREENLIKKTEYVFGRTAWDERFVCLINPGIKYFHCDEVLRPIFYENAGKWQEHTSDILRIVTTINAEMYKGLDMVLETATILKNKTSLQFEWIIIGLNKENRILKMMEINKKVRFKNTSIIFKGVKQGQELISELLGSNLFIHPSHIDNSPNSVCEAMLLGMPVIAGYVGGIPSLIENQYNGLLYNSYDPFDLAGLIVQCATNNKSQMAKMGRNANITALKRHDSTTIVSKIKETYKLILAETK